jgi:hypothetical protein
MRRFVTQKPSNEAWSLRENRNTHGTILEPAERGQSYARHAGLLDNRSSINGPQTRGFDLEFIRNTLAGIGSINPEKNATFRKWLDAANCIPILPLLPLPSLQCQSNLPAPHDCSVLIQGRVVLRQGNISSFFWGID